MVTHFLAVSVHTRLGRIPQKKKTNENVAVSSRDQAVSSTRASGRATKTSDTPSGDGLRSKSTPATASTSSDDVDVVIY